MTVKASTLQTSAEYEPSVHNGLWNVRSCMKFSVIIFILHLIAAPSILISAIYNITNHIDSTPSESTYFIAAGATFFAGALGILIAFMNFGCLYNKNKADMYLSAPLSMKQRFFSDYLSGLASYIIPFIAAQIPTLILFAVGHFGFDGKEFMCFIEGAKDKNAEYHYICDFFGKAFPYYGRFAVGGIIAMIMLFTLTVLILTCCGTLFDSIGHVFLINVFAFCMPMLTFETFNNVFFTIDLNGFFYPLLAWTSPAGAVATLVMGSIQYDMTNSFIPLWEWALGVIINIAVTFALAYHFYRKRRAEHITKPIVFRWIYSLMMILGLCFAVILSFRNEFIDGLKFNKYFFTIVFVTFLVYMLCEIISNRGFKNLWKGAVRYVITFAAYTACIALLISTRLFGAEYYVPSADDVEKIYLGYGGAYNENVYTTFTYYGGDGSDESVFVIEDRDNIENIIAAQRISASIEKTAVENGGRNGWYEWLMENGESFDTRDFSVCCVLRSGRRVTRAYSVVNAEAAKHLMTIDVSDEYKVQAAQNLKNRFVPYNELYESKVKDEELWGTLGGAENVSIDLLLFTPVNGLGVEGTGYNKVKMDESFYNELRDAVAADRADLTADQYYRPCSDRKYSLCVDSVLWGLAIDGSWTETMKVLAAHNCFESLNDETDRILDESNTDNKRTIKISKNWDGDETGYSDVLYSEKQGVSTKEYWSGVNSGDNSRYVIHYSEDLRKLFEVMQFRYVTDEKLYSIDINGSSYPIPPEYSDVAERVFESAEKLSDYTNGTDLYYGIGAVKEAVSAQ